MLSKTSSWISTEGSSTVRYHPCRADCTYDLEFINSGDSIGIILETNNFGNFAMVQAITEDSSPIVKNAVQVGDVLVSVNNHVMLQEDFGDVISFLSTLREGGSDRHLKFLNTKKCPVSVYSDRISMKHKIKKDLFGFSRSIDFLRKESGHVLSRASITAQRDVEWVDYLKSVGGPANLKPAGVFKPNKRLKALVRRGIPVAFRPSLWLHISLASQHRLKFPPDYYTSLLRRVSEDLDEKVKIDIGKDVDRTFPEHDYFSSGDGCDVLRRVLQAYALHNPEIGYCQSLNFVAGMMILYLTEDDAFWLLVTVLDTLLPKDYYSPTMVGTYIDQFVFAHIIATRMPHIHKALEDAQLQLPLITVQWFMCLFVNTFPPETALRCWDIFLNEGSKAIFCIGVALFKMAENQILYITDSGNLYEVLKSLGSDVFDADHLISLAYRNFVAVKPSNYFEDQQLVQQMPSVSGKRSSKCSVPMGLVGFGLAHLGPSSAQPAGPMVHDEPIENTAHTERIGKTSARLALAGPLRVTKPELRSIPSLRSARDQGFEYRGTSEKTLKTAAQKAATVRKALTVADYRSFKRRDITTWRDQFRPEVESRFNVAKTAREEWQDDEAELNEWCEENDPLAEEPNIQQLERMEQEVLMFHDKEENEIGVALVAPSTPPHSSTAEDMPVVQTIQTPMRIPLQRHVRDRNSSEDCWPGFSGYDDDYSINSDDEVVFETVEEDLSQARFSSPSKVKMETAAPALWAFLQTQGEKSKMTTPVSTLNASDVMNHHESVDTGGDERAVDAFGMSISHAVHPLYISPEDAQTFQGEIDTQSVEDASCLGDHPLYISPEDAQTFQGEIDTQSVEDASCLGERVADVRVCEDVEYVQHNETQKRHNGGTEYVEDDAEYVDDGETDYSARLLSHPIHHSLAGASYGTYASYLSQSNVFQSKSSAGAGSYMMDSVASGSHASMSPSWLRDVTEAVHSQDNMAIHSQDHTSVGGIDVSQDIAMAEPGNPVGAPRPLHEEVLVTPTTRPASIGEQEAAMDSPWSSLFSTASNIPFQTLRL